MQILLQMFPDLSNGWNIALLIIMIGAALYILLFILNIIFALSFRSMMKRDNRTLCVLLTAKLDLLNKLDRLFKEYNVFLDDETAKILKYLDVEDMIDQQDPSCQKSRDDLTYVYRKMSEIYAENETLQSVTSIKIDINSFTDIDRGLNVNIMRYNADVLGYNYWIRFLPFRYIFLLFRIKTKKTIN